MRRPNEIFANLNANQRHHYRMPCRHNARFLLSNTTDPQIGVANTRTIVRCGAGVGDILVLAANHFIVANNGAPPASGGVDLDADVGERMRGRRQSVEAEGYAASRRATRLSPLQELAHTTRTASRVTAALLTRSATHHLFQAMTVHHPSLNNEHGLGQPDPTVHVTIAGMIASRHRALDAVIAVVIILIISFEIWSLYIRHICATRSTVGREHVLSADHAVMLDFFYSLCVRSYGLPK